MLILATLGAANVPRQQVDDTFAAIERDFSQAIPSGFYYRGHFHLAKHFGARGGGDNRPPTMFEYDKPREADFDVSLAVRQPLAVLKYVPSKHIDDLFQDQLFALDSAIYADAATALITFGDHRKSILDRAHTARDFVICRDTGMIDPAWQYDTFFRSIWKKPRGQSENWTSAELEVSDHGFPKELSRPLGENDAIARIKVKFRNSRSDHDIFYHLSAADGYRPVELVDMRGDVPLREARFTWKEFALEGGAGARIPIETSLVVYRYDQPKPWIVNQEFKLTLDPSSVRIGSQVTEDDMRRPEVDPKNVIRTSAANVIGNAALAGAIVTGAPPVTSFHWSWASTLCVLACAAVVFLKCRRKPARDSH